MKAKRKSDSLENEVQKQFVAALNFLLKQEGRGSQAQLARAISIHPGSLSHYVHGKTIGSIDTRSKIAAYFGFDYVELLSFGKKIIEGNVDKKNMCSSKDSRGLEPNLLKKIVVEVERYLQKHQLSLRPLQKGDVFILLYESRLEKQDVDFQLTSVEKRWISLLEG